MISIFKFYFNLEVRLVRLLYYLNELILVCNAKGTLDCVKIIIKSETTEIFSPHQSHNSQKTKRYVTKFKSIKFTKLLSPSISHPVKSIQKHYSYLLLTKSQPNVALIKRVDDPDIFVDGVQSAGLPLPGRDLKNYQRAQPVTIRPINFIIAVKPVHDKLPGPNQALRLGGHLCQGREYSGPKRP